MKKILSIAAIAAITTIMMSATAFGSCPLKMNQTSCSIGKQTGAAAPVSNIVVPSNQQKYVLPCVNCANQSSSKTILPKTIMPFTGIYNSIFGPFTNLYY